jgi:hypothetical protein
MHIFPKGIVRIDWHVEKLPSKHSATFVRYLEGLRIEGSGRRDIWMHWLLIFTGYEYDSKKNYKNCLNQFSHWRPSLCFGTAIDKIIC